jgi:hypothetical protein
MGRALIYLDYLENRQKCVKLIVSLPQINNLINKRHLVY